MNYAPDGGVTSDDKHNDVNFMVQWTETALETLALNNVQASTQFDTGHALPLVNQDGSLTAQGQTFAKFCALQ